MRNPLTDFHIKSEELQKATGIRVGAMWIKLKFDSFKNPDQKVIELLFHEEVPSGIFSKDEAEKLIEALQKIVKEL